MRHEHNETGHINFYVRDRESYRTGFGRHQRVIVFGTRRDGWYVRCDNTPHDRALPLPTLVQIARVMRHEGQTFRMTDLRGLVASTADAPNYLGHICTEYVSLSRCATPARTTP